MIEFLINQFDWSFDQPDWLIYWSACCANDLLINQSDWLNDYPIDLLSWTYWYIYILIYWSDCLTDTLITLYVCFFISSIQMFAVLLLHVRCGYGLAERIFSERNRKSDPGLVTLWWPRQSVEHRWSRYP